MSSITSTIGGDIMTSDGGVVSQWSDKWNGMPCEALGGRTYVVWDAWEVVSFVPMPLAGNSSVISLFDLNIYSS